MLFILKDCKIYLEKFHWSEMNDGVHGGEGQEEEAAVFLFHSLFCPLVVGAIMTSGIFRGVLQNQRSDLLSAANPQDGHVTVIAALHRYKLQQSALTEAPNNPELTRKRPNDNISFTSCRSLVGLLASSVQSLTSCSLRV